MKFFTPPFTKTSIEAQYKKLAALYHPDKHSSDQAKQHFTALFQKLQEEKKYILQQIANNKKFKETDWKKTFGREQRKPVDKKKLAKFFKRRRERLQNIARQRQEQNVLHALNSIAEITGNLKAFSKSLRKNFR